MRLERREHRAHGAGKQLGIETREPGQLSTAPPTKALGASIVKDLSNL